MSLSLKYKNDIYLKYFFRNPILYPVLLKLFIQKTIAFLRNRIRNNNEIFHKSRFNTRERREIVKVIKNISNIKASSHTINDLPPLYYNIVNDFYDQNDIMIHLATQSVNLGEDFYNRSFEDKEDIFSANRFIWLYEVLFRYPYHNVIEFCYSKILDWIDENNQQDKGSKFESYSISERVIAWLFFLQFTKDKISLERGSTDKILESIIEQVNYLMYHLEFRGKQTNNHVLNNARALYIVGRLLKLHEIELLGKRIFKTEYIGIINDKGVYQEGSTHYQMLLTKNLIEALLVSEVTKDTSFKNYLEPIIKKMINVCNTLQSEYNIEEFPLIGDISPDMPPDWFVGYPFSIKNNAISKWYRLFQFDVIKLLNIKFQENYLLSSGKTSWKYLNHNGFEVWVNVRNGPIPCHGHNDNGSIVVYYKGKPVIIDVGLGTYVNKAKQSQSGYKFHNTPLINGFSVDIPLNSLIPKTELISKVYIHKINSSLIEYRIKYANPSIELQRIILIDSKILKIVDRVEQPKTSTNYEVVWNFDDIPKETDNNKYLIGNTNLEFSSEGSLVYNNHKNLNSKKYGNYNNLYRITSKAKLKINSIQITLKSIT